MSNGWSLTGVVPPVSSEVVKNEPLLSTAWFAPTAGSTDESTEVELRSPIT